MSSKDMSNSNWNAAFVGGGVCSIIGLGEYSVVKEKMLFNSFSGASIGAVIAVCLAAGKEPEEVRDFLAENVSVFCKFIVGNYKIKRKVNNFLGNELYRNLQNECIVSITPIRVRKNFPTLITRENAGKLTAGKVAALSASLPGLFLPGIVRLNGKISFVLDGGILFNPPLNETKENFLFTFIRTNKTNKKPTKLSLKKLDQEKKATKVIKAKTTLGTLGCSSDVMNGYNLGVLEAINNGF